MISSCQWQRRAVQYRNFIYMMMLSPQMQRVSRRLFRGQLRCSSASADPKSGAPTTMMADQKRELAQAALKQVPQHGWTQDAITAAVLEHPNMTISMSGLLTPSELVHWLMDDFNRQLRDDPSKSEWSVLEKIKWRLEQVAPLAKSGQWHKGMALGLTTPLTTRCQLHEFIELVAPPGSSMMYQTTLGGIFVASELYLLSDSSPGYEQTWAFLESRLEELEKGEFVNISGAAAASVPLAATSAVAFSLFEGLSSLILPSSMYGVPGASPSDYTAKDSHKN